MTYGEQLSAARYRAERDQARQALARWENGYGQKAVNEINYYLNQACEACGVDPTGMAIIDKVTVFRDKVSNRLMPEGMEWPRFEDGEAVKIGDMVPDVRGGSAEVVSIEFFDDEVHIRDLEGFKSQGLAVGESVKRPKALAGDGEPLEVGQMVWHVSNGIEFTVIEIINQGERPFVKLRLNDDGSFTALDPDQLTHTKPGPPDSLERIEADAEALVYGAAQDAFHGLEFRDELRKGIGDLMRRCKKLAGVSE